MEASLVPGIAGLLMLIGLGGGLGLPLGVPPEPEDLILAQVAPEECLFYCSWAGTAEPDAQSTNQVEQLLAEPEIQHLTGEIQQLVGKGLRRAALEEEGPKAAAVVDDLLPLAKRVLTRPGAVFVSKLQIAPGGPDVQAGLLLNLGDAAERLKAALEKHQQEHIPDAVRPVEIGVDTYYRITPPNPDAPVICWGVKGGYFGVGVGEGAIEGMLERAETDPPDWLVHIGRQLPIPRRSTVTYVDAEALREIILPLADDPGAERVVKALGLGQVKSLVSVRGLDETGFVAKALVELDGEPEGLLRLAAGKGLGVDDVAPIPADATIALGARVDPEQVLDTILSAAGQVDPDAREEIVHGLGEMQERLGFNLRRELLGPLGDVLCVYNSPSEGGLLGAGLTAVIEVDDRQQLAATHARLLATARVAIGDRRRGPRIDQFAFAGREVFVLNARDDDFLLAPSWCLTDDALVISAFPQNIKAYLARGEEHRSIAAVPAVAELLRSGEGPVALTYVDTRTLFETAYPVALIIAQAAFGELSKDEGIDVSVSILPSVGAVAKHLMPTVTAVRRTEAGIEVLTQQTRGKPYDAAGSFPR